jgi:hypothetical protein
MSDAQKAPAPSAETERAVEVDAQKAREIAAKLSPTQKKIMRGGKPSGQSQHGGWTSSYAVLFRLGLLDALYRETPLGLAVARSLKGEG